MSSSETRSISTPAWPENFFSCVHPSSLSQAPSRPSHEPSLVVTPSDRRPSPMPSRSTMTLASRSRSNASQHQRPKRGRPSTPLAAGQRTLDLFLGPSTSRPNSPRPRPFTGSAQRSITSFWAPQSDVGPVSFLSIPLMAHSLLHAHHSLVRWPLIRLQLSPRRLPTIILPSGQNLPGHRLGQGQFIVTRVSHVPRIQSSTDEFRCP